MKSFHHPIFIFASLCLFFPIGIILLVLSELDRKHKIWMAFGGGALFLLLLLSAFLIIPKQPQLSPIEVRTTDTHLNVGQSGGFSVLCPDGILTHYSIKKDNDNITISDNVYTAVREGKTTVTIAANGSETEFTIIVDNKTVTDTTVFLSVSGSRYHSNKKHAGKNAFSMTEEEAIQSGKTPCKICYK